MQVGAHRAIWDLGQVKAELDEALGALGEARGRQRRSLLRRIRLLLLWVDEIVSEREVPEPAAGPATDSLFPAVLRILISDDESGSLLDGSHPGLQSILVLRKDLGLPKAKPC